MPAATPLLMRSLAGALPRPAAVRAAGRRLGASAGGAAALDCDAVGHVLGGDALGLLSHEGGDGVVVGAHALHLGLDAGLLEEHLDVLALLGQDEGDHGARGASAGGAARAVQVGLVLGGRVDVDDELDTGDVDPAGGDVGGDHDAHGPRGERAHGPLAGALAHIALELDGGDARAHELAGQAAGEVLGAGEEDALAGPGGQTRDDAVLGGLVRQQPDAVVHIRHRGGGRVDGVLEGVVEELADDGVHAVVEGGGEEHPLAVGGGGAQDAAHAGQEAEVGHVVGLVDDGDADLVQVAVPLGDEVEEAPGAGDDDVHARAQGFDLRVLVDAAEDRRDGQVEGGGQRCDGLGDLEGELAGGGQDEADGVAGAGAVLVGEALDEGQREGEGLAAAGAAPAEDVAPGEGVAEGGGLDGEGSGESARGEVGDEIGVHAEAGEVWGGGLPAGRGGRGGGGGGSGGGGRAGALAGGGHEGSCLDRGGAAPVGGRSAAGCRHRGSTASRALTGPGTIRSRGTSLAAACRRAGRHPLRLGPTPPRPAPLSGQRAL